MKLEAGKDVFFKKIQSQPRQTIRNAAGAATGEDSTLITLVGRQLRRRLQVLVLLCGVSAMEKARAVCSTMSSF